MNASCCIFEDIGGQKKFVPKFFQVILSAIKLLLQAIPSETTEIYYRNSL